MVQFHPARAGEKNAYVGASAIERRGDIRNQFLVEAVTLSAAGGLFGVAIGLLGGLLLTRAFQLPFTLSIGAITLAVGVSMVIGVVFGFYPALRASRLDPIVALRSE